MLIFDAAALGLFAVKASAFEVSAVGGGIVRDVLANDAPELFHPDSLLYARPAALGATGIVVTWRNDVYSGGLAIGVITRVASLRFGWRAPRQRACWRRICPRRGR